MARLSIKGILFVGVAVGCLLVLVLAMSGVFRPAPPPVAPPPPKSNSGELVLENPYSHGEDWQLTAAKAVVLPSQEIHFVSPVIRYTQKATTPGAPPREFKVTADEGISSSQEAADVHLTNHVAVLMTRKAVAGSAAESGAVHTDDLVWNKQTAVGQASGPVRADYTIGDKAYRITGVGMTLDLRQHVGRVEHDVRAILPGDVGLMPETLAGAPASPPPTPPADVRTVVGCEGPLVAEEVTGNITLDNKVVVTRADQVLRTDRLIAHIGKSGQGQSQQIDEWQALGNVRLTSTSAEFVGKKLLSGADGYMTLIGNSPCTIKLEGMLIEGESISMDMQKNTVTVPGAGKLIMEPKPPVAPGQPGATPSQPGETPAPKAPESPPPPGGTAAPKAPEPPPKPTTITWTEGMDFDRKAGKGVFTKDVHVTGQDLEITCRLMTLWMNADQSDIDKLLAEGDAHMTTAQASATGNSILYLMKDQRLELKGEPVATLEEQGHTVTASRLQLDQATGDLTANVPGTLVAALSPEKGSQAQRQAKITWVSSMSYNDKQREGHFQGNVAMNSPTQEITGDSMIVKLTPPPTRDLQAIDAEGTVQINMQGKRGYGDLFHWEADGGKGYLLGKRAIDAQPGIPAVDAVPAAVALQGQGWARGQRITFRDNFDVIKVEGPPVVSSVSSKPAPAPKPAPPAKPGQPVKAAIPASPAAK